MDQQFALQPSVEAVKVLRRHFGADATEDRLALASQGSHILNPYHNLVHELQVVYWSHLCLVNEPNWSLDLDGATRDRGIMLEAALFHDHNHCGRLGDDSKNIDLAKNFSSKVGIKDHRSARNKMIGVTEFKGFLHGEPVFAHVPENIYEKALRDADLMSIYTEEGRVVLLGLAEEMGKPWSEMSVSEIRDSLDRNAEFLRKAPMHTWMGRRIKELHLDRSLHYFSDMVIGLNGDVVA